MVSQFWGRTVLPLGVLLLAIWLPWLGGQEPPSKNNGTQSPKASQTSVADVHGDWQVSWQNRLGTQQCVLHLQQEGTKLTGTLHDVHGDSPLSGSIADKQVVFDVEFQGAHPFSIRFTGNMSPDKIEGTSQATGVGGGGAYLGHGGEVTQPEHPWTAKRGAAVSAPAPKAGVPVNSSSARNRTNKSLS